MRSLWSWKKDRQMLSAEKHEQYYARRLAKWLLAELEDRDGREIHFCRVSKLKRICQYALRK